VGECYDWSNMSEVEYLLLQAKEDEDQSYVNWWKTTKGKQSAEEIIARRTLQLPLQGDRDGVHILFAHECTKKQSEIFTFSDWG
jgi:hypothetical protein